MENDKWAYVGYILLGYGSGSILFAWLIPKFLLHMDITEKPEDHNPGTFNVFTQAGTAVGLAVLVLELAKGFFPVWAAGRNLSRNDWAFSLVMAAPVIGHAFPFWNVHKGGKAIAVSFGVLLGLAPDCRALGILVCCYLFFSLVVVVTPNLYRSVLTYGCVSLLSVLVIPQKTLVLGVLLLSGVVILRHFMQYRRENVSVHVGLYHKKEDEGC